MRFRAGEGPVCQGHDAPVALGGLAEVERLTKGGLQAVDQRQPRLGQPVSYNRFLLAADRRRAGSLGWRSSGVTVTLHPLVER